MKITLSCIKIEFDITESADGVACVRPHINQYGSALWTAEQCRELSLMLGNVADAVDRENGVIVDAERDEL